MRGGLYGMKGAGSNRGSSPTRALQQGLKSCGPVLAGVREKGGGGGGGKGERTCGHSPSGKGGEMKI
jgi:hypothetical protein